MNCDETFNAGICYVTDAYKRVCGFNDDLHADLEKCRSENAKLREQVDAAHMSRLLTENENESLRELCEDMLSCIEIQIAFDRTPKKRMYKEFAGRARELGVEVDE